ncbi:hypothetical protein NL676_014121 [Syzygium grande]|nr:hypothetical protein NL676_014121 [Syzygium grande]
MPARRLRDALACGAAQGGATLDPRSRAGPSPPRGARAFRRPRFARGGGGQRGRASGSEAEDWENWGERGGGGGAHGGEAMVPRGRGPRPFGWSVRPDSRREVVQRVRYKETRKR